MIGGWYIGQLQEGDFQLVFWQKKVQILTKNCHADGNFDRNYTHQYISGRNEMDISTNPLEILMEEF